MKDDTFGSFLTEEEKGYLIHEMRDPPYMDLCVFDLGDRHLKEVEDAKRTFNQHIKFLDKLWKRLNAELYKREQDKLNNKEEK